MSKKRNAVDEQHAAVVESLKAQLQEQIVANGFRVADAVFLEQQLGEKSRALDECQASVEMSEKRQMELIDENRALRDEQERLLRILESREQELLKMKGLQDRDDETF